MGLKLSSKPRAFISLHVTVKLIMGFKLNYVFRVDLYTAEGL